MTLSRTVLWVLTGLLAMAQAPASPITDVSVPSPTTTTSDRAPDPLHARQTAPAAFGLMATL